MKSMSACNNDNVDTNVKKYISNRDRFEVHTRLHHILAQIQELSLTKVGKHQQIRINLWVRKLLEQPLSNGAWRKNLLAYASALLEMVIRNEFDEPFVKLPPQGPLPVLPRQNTVSAYANIAKTIRKTPKGVKYLSKQQSQVKCHICNSVDDGKLSLMFVDKQCQTAESCDRLEWKRVWKIAFEQMKQNLQDKDHENKALNQELIEVRSFVSAQTDALEKETLLRKELYEQHQRELESMQSLHQIEVENLHTRYKAKLHELINSHNVTTEIEELATNTDSPSNPHSSSFGNFLEYIDEFYSTTKSLTLNTK